ncbi:hypothetical protein GWR56_07280 [Mucilaginibacter sp. 14171R-50]|uniref:flavodoxin domain-containing protein n=1 Tax=Mucilaginibacter sp. 14171R-50 TaxID=2703789 RepID=UPI00138B324E|nr:flavodoxin domain-containing protein [Mucilaginibacter sp. 14171R-50]QHS55349.1 hypothetical protein GWR56_07280 [Mucilaginibacter sp. 14171R-50]
MKGIIIYAGKYGATCQYAQWLADTLKFPVLPAEKATAASLQGYDSIILGSSVYIGKLVIRRWLQQHESALAGKQLFLFIVCGSAGANNKEQDKLLDNNLSAAIRQQAKIFFMPGRCVISKLSFKDRLLLRLGSMLVKDAAQKAGMRNGFDLMNRKALDGLIGEFGWHSALI